MTGEPQRVPDLVRMHKPQLVLLDLVLPGTDGIELMQRAPELGDLPVIFISGYRREETIARALERLPHARTQGAVKLRLFFLRD